MSTLLYISVESYLKKADTALYKLGALLDEHPQLPADVKELIQERFPSIADSFDDVAEVVDGF